MVTIEQKLTLFSKLLNQDIKEEMDKKFNALEGEYQRRIAENKFLVDKEAAEIIEQARRRAELKKVELISKGKLANKKEMTLVKEELIARFMTALENKIKDFTKTEEYKLYLSKKFQELKSLKGSKNHLEVYLTPSDYEMHQNFIKEGLVKIGLKEDKLSFNLFDQDMLGGFIIEDPVLRIRIDESIRTLIQDKTDEMIEKISLAIGEVGGSIYG